MKPVLIDTSILIDFLRASHKEKTPFMHLVEQGTELFVSIITHTELYAGKSVWEKPQARKELEILFSGIKILPITTSISTMAGKIRASYSTDLIDALIAATAIENGYSLATLNRKDFEKIEGIRLV